jgi:N-methylhydantoinase B
MKNGIGMAECGAHAPASMAVISGLDPRNRNEPFINQVYLFDTGGAAAPDTDAWLTICHAGNAGMHLIDSVELDELHFPIIVTTRRMLADTEGAGRTLGAPAGLCEYGPLGGSTLSVSFVADGHVNPAKGTRGGRDGSRNRNFLRMPNGELEEHSGVCFLTLTPGESVVAYTPGGGGYGSPCERPAAAVAADVREGWVTEKRAKEIYGVVLDKDGEVDPEATRHARSL